MSDLGAFLRACDNGFHPAYPPASLQLRLPVNFDAEDEDFRNMLNGPVSIQTTNHGILKMSAKARQPIGEDLVCAIEPPRYLTYKQANITPHPALIHHFTIVRESLNSYDDLDNVVQGWAGVPLSQEESLRAMLKSAMPKMAKHVSPHQGYHLFCFDHYHPNYTHLVFETLARLYAVKDFLPELPVIVPAALRSSVSLSGLIRPVWNRLTGKPNHTSYDPTAFIRPLLDIFGVKPEQYVYTPPDGSYLLVQKLLMPTHAKFYAPIMRPAVELLKSHANLAAGQGEKIYIRRGNAKFRRLINEDEVIACLEGYGFKAVSMENYPFLDEIGIMHQAKYVVCGAHSGLTNMMFQQPGSRLLELSGNDTHLYPLYIASLFDINLYLQFCPKADPSQGWFEGHILVDIEKLRRNVEAMMEAA